MAESQALLVPLRAGGGTRLKILEAFGVGLPVVTTSKGAEGLPVVGGRHAMVEDTAAGFAKAVESVLSDSATCARLASAAAELVNAGFRWPAIAARFQRVLGEVAAEGRVIAGGIDDGPSESSRRAG
jgi:glycosyltransferase involved in cell wall biosynthesis